MTRSLNWPRNYWFCSENEITNGFRENILLCILLYTLLYSILLVRIYWSLKSILHCNSQYFQGKYVAEYNIITCICHLDNLQQLMDHLSLLSVVTEGCWIPNECWLLIKLLLIWIDCLMCTPSTKNQLTVKTIYMRNRHTRSYLKK